MPKFKKRNSSLGKSHQPRWLLEQHQGKKQITSSFVRFLVLLVVIFAAGYLSLKLFFELRKSYWDGKHNFNLAVSAGEEIYVIGVRPTSNQVNILYIPHQTYLSLSKGFGEYPAASVWRLGQLENFGGGKLLQLSAQNFLGVPVLGWARVEKFPPPKVEENNTGAKRLLVQLGFKVWLSRKGNLSWWDKLRLFKTFNSVSSGKINFYPLFQTQASQTIVLPDGQRAYRVQKEYLDRLSGSLFKDNELLGEDIEVGVVNKTENTGMSSQVARIIDNIGGNATMIPSQDGYNGEGIWCSGEQICASYTVELFSKTFNLEIRRGKIEPSRIDALIILGNEYWRYFYEK